MKSKKEILTSLSLLNGSFRIRFIS